MLKTLPTIHRKNHYIVAILFFVLILAIFLRFKGLVFQSYWFDELFSAHVSNPSNTLSIVISKTMADVHPPLYQILLWGWYHIFGYSDISGRALSALFGTLSVVAMYFMAKEFYNKETGLYAALIASVNYFLIYFSQETRSYMLVFLLTILSYMYFLRLTKKYTLNTIVLYLLSTIALLYTHYFAFFLIFTQLIGYVYIVSGHPKNRKELFKIGAIVTIILTMSILPLVGSIITLSHQSSTWMETPSSWFFIDYMKAYVLSPFLYKIFLLLLGLTLATLFIKRKNNPFLLTTIILVLWIVIAYLMPYIKSVLSVPLLSPKNTIIVIPAFIALISFGIYKLRYLWLKLIVIFAIIFFSLYHLYRMQYYTTVTKDQFKSVVQELSKEKKKFPYYDIIMYHPSFKSYYFNTQAKLSNIDIEISENKNLRKQYTTTAKPNCFWVLQAHKNYISEKNILNNKNLKVLRTIDKFHAQALLYGYKKTLAECTK